MPEAVLTIEIVVPDEFIPDVLEDLANRRAHIDGLTSQHGLGLFSAHVPVAEMLDYTTKLAALTDGRGSCRVLDWTPKG